MRSSVRSQQRKKAPASRSIKVGAAAVLLTFSGAAAGMLMDGVSETILTFRDDQASKPVSPLPPSVKEPSKTAAPPAPIHPVVQPEPAWFPANNAAQWAISVRPGQPTIPLNIENLKSKQNGLVRFYRATGSPSSPWQRAATLHVRAENSATIRLPQGHYLVARTAAPATLQYDEIAKREPDETVQLTVGTLGHSPIRIAIDRTDAMPIQNPTAPHRYALASSRRNDARSTYRSSHPLKPVRSVASVQPTLDEEEYAGLVEAALDET